MTLHLLGGPASCSWLRIPIHPGPQSGKNCPTLWLLPPSPFSHPTVHITYTIYIDDINNLDVLRPGKFLNKYSLCWIFISLSLVFLFLVFVLGQSFMIHLVISENRAPPLSES
jgi:hypothetical protein